MHWRCDKRGQAEKTRNNRAVRANVDGHQTGVHRAAWSSVTTVADGLEGTYEKREAMAVINQADYLEIQRVIHDWAIFRDSLQFDRLLELWHEDGMMMTTWSQVPAAEFVRLSRDGAARGVRVQHLLGGCHIEIVGERAVAQTKTTIIQRGLIDGVLCDAVCISRFYDLFERRADVWKIVFRQPIYESDRLDPVHPGAALVLEAKLLESFPEGYRYLGYLQTKLGMTVKRDMPGLVGPEVEALYTRGAGWLRGCD